MGEKKMIILTTSYCYYDYILILMVILTLQVLCYDCNYYIHL